MEKLLVTGATGVSGRSTIAHLLKKGVPADQIIGLSRKTDGIPDLAAKGVEIRFGDYLDYDSLLRAFEGVDKIMLVSAVAFSDRFTQHYNVITAARQAGVKHIVYMSIIRKPSSGRILPEVTESDLFTEQVLRSSGLNYTIIYNPPFMDLLSAFYGADPFKNGIQIPANKGSVAAATRDELAEAYAEILTSTGHENKSYSLGGSSTISFAEIAEILEEIKGQPVSFKTISAEVYIDGIVAKGLPRQVAEFITSWVIAIEEEEFEHRSGDLEKLLGRKSLSFKEYILSTLV